MHQSESIADLAQALAAVQGQLTNPTKNKTATIPTKGGGSFKYEYADLADVISDTRPVLAAHGLSVLQEAVSAEAGVGIVTRILHTSGQWIDLGPFWLPAAGDARSAGSSVTYARRYALCAALGVAADEDDDGASGVSTGPRGDPIKRATASATPGAPFEGGEPPSEAGGAGKGQGEGLDPASPKLDGLPTFEDLVRAAGGKSLARVQLNSVTGKEYTPATVHTATPDELLAALASLEPGGYQE